MNQYFGAITMLIRTCEAGNVTMRGWPPKPLTPPPTLSLGSFTKPHASLLENLQPLRYTTLGYLECKADEEQSPPSCRAQAPLCQPSPELRGHPMASPSLSPRAPFLAGPEL